MLLKGGADISFKDSSFGDTRSAIHKAASQGHFEIVKLFLDQGSAALEIASEAGRDGLSALDIARKEGHAKVLDLLDSCGVLSAKPSQNDNESRSNQVAKTEFISEHENQNTRPAPAPSCTATKMNFGIKCTSCGCKAISMRRCCGVLKCEECSNECMRLKRVSKA